MAGGQIEDRHQLEDVAWYSDYAAEYHEPARTVHVEEVAPSERVRSSASRLQ